MAEVVRTPIGPDARLPKQRTLDERLFVRWPGVYAALSRAVNRLPPRSRLRRVLVRRATLSGWAIWARGDFELMLVRFAPDYRWEPAPELLPVGLRSVYEGHEGLRELATDMREAWARFEVTPCEIVDAGYPVVVLGKVHVRGRGSGLEFDYRVGSAYWVERGLIVRQRDFADWDEALRAAGIQPEAARGARETAGTKRAPN